MLNLLKYLDARLGEASTWSALAALFLALHVNIDPGVWKAITLWGTVGSAGLGFLITEASSGKTAGQTAQDILAALVTLTNRQGSKP